MNLLTYIPLIAKAIAYKNVKNEMDSRADVINRPWWMSGRFIGLAMTTVLGSAVSVSVLNAGIANVTELANLIYDNNALLASVGGMLYGIARGILGYIQRKK